MEISFDTNVKEKELYKFSINNMYRKITGVIWILFSIAVIVVTIYTWGKVDIMKSILMIVIAALYTVVNPLLLWGKAKAQIKRNESFHKPLHYVINEKGITISQDDKSETTKWQQMWKAVRYGDLIVVYVSTVRAFIIPLKDVGDKYDSLIELLNGGLKNRNYVKRKQK